MHLTVKGKNMDVGDALRTQVEDSLKAHVSKYFDQAVDATVIFSKHLHLFTCDVSVHAGRGIVLQSSGESSDPYIAFDGAVNKVSQRLSRHKKKLRNHHKEGLAALSQQVQKYILNATDFSTQEDEGEAPLIIAEMAVDIHTLSVSEAVMRLDLGELPALLFKNSSHGDLNMVYRRPDGHVGWVDPAGVQRIAEV